LCWRALATRHDQLQLTAHLIDRNDRDEGRTTGDLFGPDYAFGNWPAQVTCVPSSIGVPSNAAGLYRIELDVDAVGLGRIPVLSHENQPISDKLFLAPLKIPPEPPLAGDLAQALHSSAKFGNIFALQAYRIKSVARAGDSFALTLYWSAVAATDKDYTVFVHLLDANGKVVAQTDAQPRSGLYPTSLWDPGEVIRDDYALALPTDLAPGEYRIEIGAYEFPSLTRLPVASANGRALGDRLLLDPVVQVQ
jgi:hypothetical protein